MIFMRTFPGILISISFFSTMTMADPTPVDLTIKDALTRSFDYSKPVKIADSAVKQAQDNYSKAKSALFPTLNFVGSGYEQENPSGSISTSSSGAPVVSSGSQIYSASLQLTQPLYAGGAISSGMDLYQSLVDIAKQNLFNAKQTVADQTLVAFYNLLQAQELYVAAVKNRDILKTYLDITNGYTKIGRSRDIDKIQAEVNYQLSLSTVDLSGNNLNVNNAALKILLGDTSDTVYRVVDPEIPEAKYHMPDLDQSLKLAIAQNPLYKVAVLQEKSVVATEGVDVALDMPSLNLVGSGGYTSSDLSNFFVPGAQNYRVGLVLTIPLFSGLSSVYKVNSYQEQIYQAKKNQEVVIDNLRQQVIDGIKNVGTYLRELDMAERTVKTSRRGLEIANIGFKRGIVTNVDVINMQSTNYAAENLFISSKINLLQSLLTFRQAIGSDLEAGYTNGELNP